MLSKGILHFLKKGHECLLLFSRGRDKVSSCVSEDISVGEILKKVLTHFSLNDSATSFDMSKIITSFLLSLVCVSKDMQSRSCHPSLILSHQTLKQLFVILSS